MAAVTSNGWWITAAFAAVIHTSSACTERRATDGTPRADGGTRDAGNRVDDAGRGSNDGGAHDSGAKDAGADARASDRVDAGPPEVDAGDAGALMVDGGWEGCGGDAGTDPCPIGGACESDMQCASGQCLQGPEWPEGYCTLRDCDQPENACPPGSECRYSGAGSPYMCMKKCQAQKHCSELYHCDFRASNGVTGMCLPGAVGPPGAIGAICDSDVQCTSGQCLRWPESPVGYCTVRDCHLEENLCPRDSVCIKVEGFPNLCMKECVTHRDCDAPFTSCVWLEERGVNVCRPYCGVLPCPAIERCQFSECRAECIPNPGSPENSVCAYACDPQAAVDTCDHSAPQVCQHMPGNPPNVGFCTAPVCDTTIQCLPDETCHDGACRRPVLCDANGACPGETQCVGGPGGKCMPRCPDTGDCSTLHPALSCVTGLSPQPVCIELGAEPGWPCRPDGACDAVIDRDTVIEPGRAAYVIGLQPAPQVCKEGICRYGCSYGEQCALLGDDLDCWKSDGVCHPKGTFPGSECTPGSCSNIFVDGVEVPMSCLSAYAISDWRTRCRVSCAQGGDALCAAADPLSACATELQDEPICLPAGSFSGSICDQGCDTIEYGSGSVYEQSCVAGQCRGHCGDCAGISSGLTCASDGPAAGSCIPTP
ncbi:MAG TPA: hypothetical protein VK509_21460 [Polyangiales bacterium]|nr:hypothetical protein [Polyangiales bacterium]